MLRSNDFHIQILMRSFIANSWIMDNLEWNYATSGSNNNF